MAAPDIEDIGDCRPHCNHGILPGASGRLKVVSGHLLEEHSKCSSCPRAVPTKATATATEMGTAEPAAEPEPTDHFIRNPYGDRCTIEELARKRAVEKEPGLQMQAAVKERKMPPLSDAMAYRLLGEGKWPYLAMPSGIQEPPSMQSPEIAAFAWPLLNRFVENLKGKTTDLFAEPHVINGWDTYANPKRFDAEVQAMFREGLLLGGLSSDLPGPNAYMRLEIVGKSVLLTRDESGTFRAFENVCRHRGMELIGPDEPKGIRKLFVCPYHSWAYKTDGKLASVPFEQGFDKNAEVDIDNRNLIELPAAEKFGMLFLVPGPAKDQTNIQQMLEEQIDERLAGELSAIPFGDLHPVAEQRLRLESNWKLGLDTFGESYHFNTVHPDLRELFVGGCSVSDFFGKEGEPQHSRMVLGRFTMRMMANGEVPKEKWSEPGPLSHMLLVYHMMPNCVMLVGPTNVSCNYFWPVSPGVCDVVVRQYSFLKVENEMQKEFLRMAFGGLLDVVATEDFPLQPKIQQNFEQNPHAELVFGRNEPCLANQHRYYKRAVAGRY